MSLVPYAAESSTEHLPRLRVEHPKHALKHVLANSSAGMEIPSGAKNTHQRQKPASPIPARGKLKAIKMQKGTSTQKKPERRLPMLRASYGRSTETKCLQHSHGAKPTISTNSQNSADTAKISAPGTAGNGLRQNAFIAGQKTSLS